MAKQKDKPPQPDQHKSGFMVRLPEEHREKLKRLTGRTRRPITTEVQIALEEHYRREKLE